MKIGLKMAIFGTFACLQIQQKVDISDMLFPDCENKTLSFITYQNYVNTLTSDTTRSKT